LDTWNTRLATLDDVDALQSLIFESGRVLNSGDYSPQQVESLLKYAHGVDTQLIHDGTYFVVLEEEKFIGCGGWSQRATLMGGDHHKGDMPDPLLDPATDAARIRAFFVHPDWARKGIGSHLLRMCEQAAREAGFRSLELQATLTGAFLYARFGFETFEEVDVTLSDGIVVKGRRMRKDLG
jgi:GNAT superfamily N-acetyltransferase